MTMHFRTLAEQAAADGSISAQEILDLRRAGWGDGTISPVEAEAIFAINDRLAEHSTEWSDFFVEALGEFLVNGLEPRGYVSQSQADWLIARIDHNGHLHGLTELELLVRIVEKALNVPQNLKDYVLAQIEQAVLTGEGPTRRGPLEKGNVNSTEVGLLRRVIFAQAGDRPAAASRSEAEMLFRLKDATLDAPNAAEWKQLFVQGVGSYLSGYTSYNPLDSGRAAELEQFMNASTPSLLRFAGRMAKSDVETGMVDTFRALFGRKQRDTAAEQAAAAVVTTEENTWLQGQIDGNSRIDEYDEALLAFLEQETGR
ncbi:hypothetical protein [Novosphingobium sp. TH158]|uniref:hypothetical protein n=1 Tax=Novosphingobium sp. TH158 TaxID=2067455 RepID=UPI000C7D1735|nr:hypothetical protein [Novosphingobium sp. TH158]PLK27259.1 hypothetical protein C0V78_10445 [Novosphingobium sp. TH158]